MSASGAVLVALMTLSAVLREDTRIGDLLLPAEG